MDAQPCIHSIMLHIKVWRIYLYSITPITSVFAVAIARVKSISTLYYTSSSIYMACIQSTKYDVADIQVSNSFHFSISIIDFLHLLCKLIFTGFLYHLRNNSLNKFNMYNLTRYYLLTKQTCTVIYTTINTIVMNRWSSNHV